MVENDPRILPSAAVRSAVLGIGNHAFLYVGGKAMKYSKAEVAESRERLLSLLKPGDTVYSIIRSVSRSGISRTIDFYRSTGDGGMGYLSGYIAKVCGYPRDKSGALKVSGCGMDMAFAVVYELGHALWPNGTPAPHGTRNGEPDSDGGYALKSVVL